MSIFSAVSGKPTTWARPLARRCFGALLALLVGSAAARAADGDRSYAFLVAAAEYDAKELKPLKYTRNDILAFQKALIDAGFAKDHIVVLHDKQERRFHPEAQKIREELKVLLAGLDAADTLIVAFAGHGVQFKNEKRNYFCPVDAKLEDRKTLISVDEIYKQLERCSCKRKLLLVDACRNDPQSRFGRERGVVDLESVTRPQVETVPEGIVALYRCREGQISYEHPDLEHGIFFHHVLQGWNGAADKDKDGVLTLEELSAYVKRGTQNFARIKLGAIQVPQQINDFSGVWELRALARTKTPDVPAVVPPPIATKDEKSITNSIGMKLALIPAGKFMMGSPESEKDRDTNEGPQHEVEITKPFHMGIHEVTVGQFRAFVNDMGYKTDAEKDGKGGWGWTGEKFEQKPEFIWTNPGFPQTENHPVVLVSWNDAKAFCDWLSKKEGRTYRLPTEAQWEYACRGRTTTRYFSGDEEDDLKAVANVADASFKRKYPSGSWAKSWDDGYPFTAPVGRFQANAFGLHDVHGNVWEWCADWYDGGYYKDSPRQDPENTKEAPYRVIRGGGWLDGGGYCRSAIRWDSPARRYIYLGFRVAAVQSR